MPEKKIEIVLQDNLMNIADELSGMAVGMVNYCPDHKVAVVVLRSADSMKVDGICLLRGLEQTKQDVIGSARSVVEMTEKSNEN